MARAILSFGSNLGDRMLNLNSGIRALESVPGVKIEKISSFYETEPFETSDPQRKYINCCIYVETDLKPFMLLGACLGIEASYGRKRPFKFSPRTLDIDLIMYENEVINDKYLTLPHPRMRERAFVLVPMMEIFPEGIFAGVDFKERLEQCNVSEILKIE